VNLEHFVATATVISSLAGRFVGYPAQIRLIVRTRVVSNVSVSLYLIGFLSCVLWTWHGWLIHDWVILLTQGIAGIAATGSMLFLLWRYRPRALADESVWALLVHVASLDGEMDVRERTELLRIGAEWGLKPDFSLVQRSMSVSERHSESVRELQRYLLTRPPVARLRELKDVVWLLVRADGVVTDHERVLMNELYNLLDAALLPFESTTAAMEYRVVLVRRDSAPQPPSGFEAIAIGDQSVVVSQTGHTQLVARQYAADLRSRGIAALVVREQELGVGSLP
jgi:uncharacterized protein with PQ loop repeat